MAQNTEKLRKELEKIPFAIKHAAKERLSLRLSILKELNRTTNICKAEVLDFLNEETEYKLTKEEADERNSNR